MSLINCPECGKEISDKAASCPNCGYPININSEADTYNPNMYTFGDSSRDISSILISLQMNNKVEAIKQFRELFLCGLSEAVEAIEEIQREGIKTRHENKHSYQPLNSECIDHSVPRCPKCGSTSITAGQRGFSLLTGFLGSNKTVNRCSNCGHTWKPGR